MKSKINSLLFSIFLVSAGCFLGFGGCASQTKDTYAASGVTHIAATSAIHGWNEYLGIKNTELDLMKDQVKAKAERAKIGKQSAKVAGAWQKYQVAQIAVLNVAQELGKIPPSESADAQDRLTAAVSASSIALSEVLSLLQEFGVKIK